MAVMMMVTLVVVLSVILTLLALGLSMKVKEDYEKSSPYECGFDGLLSSRTPFSLRFFLLGVIFVVFDVEIALLIPIMNSIFFMNSFVCFFVSFIFVLLLFIGLAHEQREGSLDWVL
uniref:NADH-ubiquinone oxidoreductase chain 3 n=1 Tax=Geukensia demissa TaxID=27807 RepID=A0A6B9VQQ6_GEUDE|nr:NADH dehydrogenase subunit 3 [Geukensia demissa]QHO63845.1 NADH dehydrogenase subunit 3 [Geukensia demissa]UJM44213.1 NADH dehydrogenase subunit 3 [Geukensia demissa]